MTNVFVQAETAIVNEAEAIGTAIKNEFAPVATAVVADVKSALSSTEALIERNGGQLLMSEALAAVQGLVTGNWSAVVTTLVANAKAAGAATVAQEEQLAGSAALQIAQVIQTTQAAPTPPAAA